jgi:hypothetical protein
MDEDKRGLENPNTIFWKPTPDKYRMNPPRGRGLTRQDCVKLTPIWDAVGYIGEGEERRSGDREIR